MKFIGRYFFMAFGWRQRVTEELSPIIRYHEYLIERLLRLQDTDDEQAEKAANVAEAKLAYERGRRRRKGQ